MTVTGDKSGNPKMILVVNAQGRQGTSVLKVHQNMSLPISFNQDNQNAKSTTVRRYSYILNPIHGEIPPQPVNLCKARQLHSISKDFFIAPWPQIL